MDQFVQQCHILELAMTTTIERAETFFEQPYNPE